jgi:hypothetical protein
MKKFILNLIFTLTVSIGVYSQTLTTPTSQNIPIGVSGLPISGFTLDGYNSSTIYKVSLSITGNANSNFTVNTTTGLTRDFGFNYWTNITSVNFTGTPSNIENGLNSITFNTTSTIDGLINLSVLISSQQTNTYYNPTNGHMYEFVQGQYTISQARNGAKAKTFEGEPGYLVNITSAAEQNFINTKVSAFNVWIGLEDATQEGVWRWMDGPEAGQISTYYNWSGGEPNNWGSGEDYVVTRWSGGTGWNDFGPPATTATFSIGGYIVEYGTWTDPSQSTFNSTQQTQITFTQKDMLWVDYTFNFGNGINPTDFSGIMHYEQSPNTWGTTNTQTLPLNSLGKVNTTNQIQETTLGKKATTVGGNTEWCIIYDYDANLGGHRFMIDEREFQNTGINPADVSRIQIFDIYDGDVTVYNVGGFWKQYVLPDDLTTQITNSNYQSYLRRQDNWFGTKAEVSFEDYTGYKPQSFIFQSPSQAVIETMIDDIVTVSDVVLAFNELAGGGINGGLKGDLNGIQLGNADVNGDNQFDFQDTYKLLEHLTGTNPLVQSTNTLVYFMKIKTKSDYESTTTLNWKTKYNGTTLMAGVDLDNGLVVFPQYNVTWLGDVNLSHSPIIAGAVTQAINKSPRIFLSQNKERLVNIIMDVELIENQIVVSLKIPENTQNVIGSEFRVAFDNQRISFDKVEGSSNLQNFDVKRTNYIKLGSISTDGSKNLNGGVEYKIYFSPQQNFNSILGLVSVIKSELVTIDGVQIESIFK